MTRRAFARPCQTTLSAASGEACHVAGSRNPSRRQFVIGALERWRLAAAGGLLARHPIKPTRQAAGAADDRRLPQSLSMGPSLGTDQSPKSLPPSVRAPAWEKVQRHHAKPRMRLVDSVESCRHRGPRHQHPATLTSRSSSTSTATTSRDAPYQRDRHELDAEMSSAPPSGRENDGLLHYTALLHLLDAWRHAGRRACARRFIRSRFELAKLKLRGVFLESARGDLILGDRQTRPTLAAACVARRAGVRPSAD